jgi:hypothetical protein
MNIQFFRFFLGVSLFSCRLNCTLWLNLISTKPAVFPLDHFFQIPCSKKTINKPLPGGPVSPRARAHVSFVPLVPPRLIFVGVTHAPRENGDLQGVWAGDEVASTSGLRSRLRSARPAHVGRTSDPALGFASCRVGGHFLPCIRAVSTPLGSPASGKERPPNGSRHPYPLVGLLASFPSTTCFSRRI